MKTTFGNGLEIFVPEQVCKPRDKMSTRLSPSTVSERPLLTASPDEECLSFKSLWALVHNCHLRLHVEPESLHCCWNDLKNSYKRADFQPALLLGIVMSQAAHGPFLSGSNQWTKQQTAQMIAKTIGHSEFQTLREAMLKDRYGDTNGVPETPADIPELDSVENLPIYAKQKSWFQAVIALYRLALDWSLNSLILGRAVELSTGNDEMGNVEMEDEFWQDCFSL
ncbi:unnamed protein product [Cladocopium goreaui]|uniref:Uncharacterized protein n=1 Tax=Cladocopium goreaui TaxID=2562237 RepID=A0A9P1G1A3_9DINO|nr:unnamed protein product [Cladocopium goreaui]